MRWTQPDPLDHTGDLREGNLFGYAASDPVNLKDLRGTCTEDLDGTAGTPIQGHTGTCGMAPGSGHRMGGSPQNGCDQLDGACGIAGF